MMTTDADQQALQASTRRLVDAAVPRNTIRAFKADRRCFTAFMADRGRPPLAATAQDLADYVTVLLEAGSPVAADPQPLAVATIQRRLTALRAWTKQAGTDPLDMTLARRVLRGHQRSYGQTMPGRAAPVTRTALTALLAQSLVNEPEPSLRGRRDRALLLTGWAVAGRRSELVAITIADVQVVPEGALLRVRRMKTNTTQTVAVPWASDPLACPVRALLTLINGLQQEGLTTGPVFRSINHAGAAGGQLGAGSVTRILARLADQAGLPVPPGFKSWSAHGLRRGFASEARKAGADTWAISTHGSWAPGSKSLAAYLIDVDSWAQSPLRGLL